MSKLYRKRSALKENIQHLKILNLLTFLFFRGHFFPSWIRIRVQPTKINVNPDPKHCPRGFTEFRGENRTDKVSHFPQFVLWKFPTNLLEFFHHIYYFELLLKSKLHSCCRPKTLAAWLQLLEEGDFDGLTAGLIAYYDSCYKRPSDTLLR